MKRLDKFIWDAVIWLARRVVRGLEEWDYWLLIFLLLVVLVALMHIHNDINEIGVELGLDW